MRINIGNNNTIKHSTIGLSNGKHDKKSVIKEIVISIVATVIGGILAAVCLRAINL